MNQIELNGVCYLKPETVEVKLAETDDLPCEPEAAVLVMPSARRNTLNWFKLCYRDRLSLHPEFAKSRTKRMLVNPESFSPERAAIIRSLSLGVLRRQINFVQASTIEKYVDSIDNDADLEILDLRDSNQAREFYIQECARIKQLTWLSQIKNEALSWSTAHYHSKAVTTLISVLTDIPEATVKTWAPQITTRPLRFHSSKPRVNDADTEKAVALHEMFFLEYADFILKDKDLPLVVPLSKLSFGLQDYWYYNFRTNSLTVAEKPPRIFHWRPIAYTKDGFVDDPKAIQNAALREGVDLRKKENFSAFRSYYTARQSLREANYKMAAREKIVIANRAIKHFCYLLMYHSGANSDHLSYFDFNNSKMKRVGSTQRIVAFKNRSSDEPQLLYVDSRFRKYWKTFLALRDWLDETGSDSAPSIGIYTRDDKRDFGLSVVTAANIYTSLYWPIEGLSLATRQARKAHTQKLAEETGGDMELTAHMISATPETVRRHYGFKHLEDSAKELSTFFSALVRSANLRISGEASAPMTEGGEKIPVGRCEAENESGVVKIEGFDERAPDPRCSSPLSCFFCASFGIHASKEDILRLLSVKQYIQFQTQEKSFGLDDHFRKYMPIVHRIDEILDDFKSRGNEQQKIFQAAENEASKGMLDPFWKTKIDALIDAMEVA